MRRLGDLAGFRLKARRRGRRAGWDGPAAPARRFRRALEPLDALDDMHAGQRAFRARRWRLPSLAACARDRLADLEGGLEILLHHAPRAAMAGAALDHRRRRRRGSGAASRPPSGPCSGRGHGRRDAASRRPPRASSPGARPFALAMSTTYSLMSKVACGQPLHGRVVRQDQRPFELQHQRAGGHQRDRRRSPCRSRAAASSATVARASATLARSPCSSCGMPQQRG